MDNPFETEEDAFKEIVRLGFGDLADSEEPPRKANKPTRKQTATQTITDANERLSAMTSVANQPPPTLENAFAAEAVTPDEAQDAYGEMPPEDTPEERTRRESTEDAELELSGIRLVDSSEFLQTRLPSPEWIIKDFVANLMKGDLIGTSKSHKTFLALQLAISIASGKSFLGMEVTQAKRVAYVDCELIPFFLQERVKAMEDALDAHPETGFLMLCNLRAHACEVRKHATAFGRKLKSAGVEICILDPRYKLLLDGEDENTAGGLRGFLDFRDLLAKFCTVLVVGHDPKGDTSEKRITDRGAGSYTAGADFDFSFVLSPHEQDGLLVLSACSRYRPSPKDRTLAFNVENQTFAVIENIDPVVKRPGGRRMAKTPEQKDAERGKAEAETKAKLDEALAAVLARNGGLLDASNLVAKLREETMTGRNRCQDFIRAKIADGELAEHAELVRDPKGAVHPKGPRYGGVKFIGKPEAVKAYVAGFEELDLRPAQNIKFYTSHISHAS